MVVPVAAQDGEIEAEAQLLQQRQLPAHHQRRPHGALVEEAQHEQRHLVQVGMRIALGQQAGQRGHRGERGQRRGIVHGLGREALPQLDVVMAEVVGQPRLPGGVDVVAGLQHGPQLARAPAVHEPQVPAVRAREQLEHGAGLAVRPHAQDHAFIAPLHVSPPVIPAGARQRGEPGPSDQSAAPGSRIFAGANSGMTTSIPGNVSPSSR